MMKKFRCVPIFILVLFSTLYTQEEVDISVFEEVWEKVVENFYDENLHNVDWEVIGQKYYEKALEANSQRELHKIINQMLAELKASHTVLLEKEVYRDYIYTEFTNKKSWQFGFILEEVDGKFFVSALIEGGSAEENDLRLDDVVLEINGTEPKECEKLLPAGNDPAYEVNPAYFVIAKPKEQISLKIKRGDEILKKTIQAKKTNMIEATKKSITVFKNNGCKIGYIHLWHFLSFEISKIVSNAIKNEFKDVDGVIVDLRGRGGNVIIMKQVFRKFEKLKSEKKKTLIALIDENTRSAKEIYANKWKERKIGPLVGRKTTGAVLAAGFFKISDGSVLMLPVQDVKNLSGGKKLEGEGVQPDIFIEINKNDLQDEILLAGVRVITKSIKRKKAI